MLSLDFLKNYMDEDRLPNEFYLEEVINTLRKIKILNDEGIIVKHEGLRMDCSRYYFTSQIFETLRIFMTTNRNNKQTLV